MTNYEKHKETIDNMWEQGFGIGLKGETNEISPCHELECDECGLSSRYCGASDCGTSMAKWLVAEYKEPTVDWAKVPIDKPILVKSKGDRRWYKRYFAGVSEEGEIMTWSGGKTSWSVFDANDKVGWEYAKLAKLAEVK